MHERRLDVVVDGLRLSGAAYVPDDPRGLAVLLHGIPAIGPPDPHDEGYPGFARAFARRGWAAAWADMRAARGAPGFFSIEGWVRDVAAVVDAARALEGVPAAPTAIVGSSAGGAVAVEAVRRGTPADALVLLGAPAAWVSFAADARAGVRRIRDDAGMALAPEVLEDPSAWAAEFEAVVPEHAIASLSLPILVVHGAADDVVPVDHARRIAAGARSADVRIVAGAGHLLRRDPRAVALVLEWLDGVGSRGGGAPR